MVSDIGVLRYNDELPKFKASLDRLVNKYDFILSTHSITQEELPQFIDKAVREGNAILVQREYCGYMVILWKD